MSDEIKAPIRSMNTNRAIHAHVDAITFNRFRSRVKAEGLTLDESLTMLVKLYSIGATLHKVKPSSKVNEYLTRNDKEEGNDSN